MEKQLTAMIEQGTKKAVQEALAQISSPVPEPRKNELTKELEVRTIVIVKNVAKGARIYLNVESQRRVAAKQVTATEGQIQVSPEDVQRLLADNNTRELRVLGGSPKLLIEGPLQEDAVPNLDAEPSELTEKTRKKP
jgi:hypothetical protein